MVAAATRAQAPGRQLGRLIAAAQAGDELAFRRLLRRHERLLEQQAARFYLPGGDGDDVLQEARIGFAKTVRGYRPERGASFPSFARRCVARQLATAVTAARRAKHRPPNEAAQGEAAEVVSAACRFGQRGHSRSQLAARSLWRPSNGTVPGNHSRNAAALPHLASPGVQGGEDRPSGPSGLPGEATSKKGAGSGRNATRPRRSGKRRFCE